MSDDQNLKPDYDWDEPILANSKGKARKKCSDLAEQYSEPGHPVESLEPEYLPPPEGAKNQQPNFRCRFRSQTSE